jgi:hypothetical protein
MPAGRPAKPPSIDASTDAATTPPAIQAFSVRVRQQKAAQLRKAGR